MRLPLFWTTFFPAFLHELIGSALVGAAEDVAADRFAVPAKDPMRMALLTAADSLRQPALDVMSIKDTAQAESHACPGYGREGLV